MNHLWVDRNELPQPFAEWLDEACGDEPTVMNTVSKRGASYFIQDGGVPVRDSTGRVVIRRRPNPELMAIAEKVAKQYESVLKRLADA